ncbi:MAG: glycoside hydrolase family 13 protein [Thermomonas hydrothermalis]|uniref:glycoside hydrolase family 13 protein n=1 Tax=Thermomonas hydrothermalis TaxID=213588 RepID=UPI0023521EF0|nr:glycoside hydrolase family 13 protein [Thermomonas hydrothermalis]MCL6619880.1 glycoside hydrolase family 13 protein [Thermomonas hydrothermalis]
MPILTLLRRLLSAFGLWLLLPSLAAAVDVDRIEPGNWWVGMRHHQVQLLLHGQALDRATVSIDHPGVKLLDSRAGDSPHWRFVTVDIAADAQPGPVPIRISAPGAPTRVVSWSLQARAPDAASRRGFGPQDAIYLLMPDRFANGDPSNDTIAGLGDPANRADPNGRHGGDLAGIRAHLPYLAGLGITQLWLTPVQTNAQPQGAYHGYAITDFYAIDPRLGSLQDYQALATDARRYGMGLIMDVVLNHIGDHHPWLADPPRRNWIHGQGRYFPTNHRRTTVQDPHAAPEDRTAFTDGWFVPTMPDLNQQDPELARYLIQNTLWWIETAGLSGLRVDTFSYVDAQFLSHWAQAILTEYPNLTMTGEEWSTNPAIVAHWQRGKINPDGHIPWMPSMLDFPLMQALRQALTTPPAAGEDGWLPVYETLANDFQYPAPGQLVIFAENHDTTRLLAALDGDATGWRLAMALLATTRGIPQIFQGSEALLEGPRHRDDGRVRADLPGGWAGDATNIFTGAGLTPAQQQAQDWLRRLLQWRKRTPLVQTGQLTHYAPQDDVYVYFRHAGIPGQGPAVMVALNRAEAPRQLDLTRFARFLQGHRAREALDGTPVRLDTSLTLPPRAPLLLEID